MQLKLQQLKKKVRSGMVRSLGHAGGYLRRVARNSIRKKRKRSDYAPEGKPPRTLRGRLKAAIFYKVMPDKQSVIIGPAFSVIDRVGRVHEKGGRYKKERFPRRPFMGPALEKTRPRLPKFWADSVRA